jgi:hypothetical protein
MGLVVDRLHIELDRGYFVWNLLYESVSGYHLVQDSLQCGSLAESITEFWEYGE